MSDTPNVSNGSATCYTSQKTYGVRRPERADLLAFLEAGRQLPGFTRTAGMAPCDILSGCRVYITNCSHPGDGPHPTDVRMFVA